MSRHGHLLRALLGLAVATPGPAVSTLAAQAHPAEPVLIELTIGRIASRTVPAYRAGDDALIPLAGFFDLAEMRATRRGDGAFEVIVQPGGLPLMVDPTGQSIRLGKEKIPYSQNQLVATEADVFLSTSVLARALGLEWEVSWPDLQVAVLEPGNLPIARRLRRESMLRSRLARASETEYTGLQLGLERPGLAGLTLDYSLLTPTTSASATTYSTMLGLDVLGGSLALGLQSQDGAGKPPRTDLSWTGVWRDDRWLSQLRLGDGFATGPRGRTLRGVAASNSPYVRPATLGNIPFQGRLGTGWTVEAYRGGRLIGFDSVNALGQFAFDVPVQYGENPVDFVAYGPFGEIREFNQTYRVNADVLPARQFEYAASAGECRTPRCTATGNVDLRYGLSTRWTIRAGLDQFWRDSLASLTHPYVGVSGALTNAVLLEGEAVGNAVLRAALRLEPSINLQFVAEANHFARGVQAPILTPDGRRDQWTLSAFFRPFSSLGGTYLDASLDRFQAAAMAMTSGRLGGSFQVADFRFLPGIRFQRQTGLGPTASQTFFSVNTFVLPHPGLGKVLGRMTARSTIEFEKGIGASLASAYLGTPLLRGLRAETGVSWFRGSKGPGFSLLIAAELPSVRSYTAVTAGGGNEAMGTQYITGSAIYDRARGGVDFSGNPAISRGGVTGRVFLDGNANGRLDAGEEPLPDVRVVVGPVFSLSDSSGTFRVWDLLPYEPTPVTVDSSSLRSPLWVPAYAAAMVQPSPNRYRRVDIPVLPGGVIEGRLIAEGGQPTAGVSLVLRHRASGEQRIVTSFTDGTFYAIGVRPGDWELSVDAKCLETLGATAAPLSFTLPPDAEGATVSGLEVVLH